MTPLLRRRCARRQSIASASSSRNSRPISVAIRKSCTLLLTTLLAGSVAAQTSTPAVPDSTSPGADRVAPLHLRALDQIVVRLQPVEVVLHTPDGRALHTGQYLDLFEHVTLEEVLEATKEGGSADGWAAQRRLVRPRRAEGVEEGRGGERERSFAEGPQRDSEGLPVPQGEQVGEAPASQRPASPQRHASSQTIVGGVPSVILLPGISQVSPDSGQVKDRAVFRERIREELPDAVVLPGLMGERTVILRERSPEVIDLAVEGYPYAGRRMTSVMRKQRAKPVGYGMRGQAVRGVQRRLREAGFLVDLDGVFGLETREAVLRFQKQYNRDHPETQIEEDGIVGQETRSAFREVLNDGPIKRSTVGGGDQAR